MAYENKTVDYVYNLILTSLQEKFNNRLRLLPKAFLVVLAKVLSAIYIALKSSFNSRKRFQSTFQDVG